MSSDKKNTALAIVQKRHQKLKKNTRGITKPAIKRILDRAGVMVIVKDDVYPEVRSILDHFMEKVLHDATLLTQNAQRTTITREDIARSLKMNGRLIYG